MDRRRSPEHIQIAFLSLAAASIAVGCDEEEVRQCVDQNGIVVAERNCADAGATGGHGGHVGFIYRYHYGTYVPAGGHVTSGSFHPSPGHVYAPHSSITRGGFGRGGFSAGAHGSFGA